MDVLRAKVMLVRGFHNAEKVVRRYMRESIGEWYPSIQMSYSDLSPKSVLLTIDVQYDFPEISTFDLSKCDLGTLLDYLQCVSSSIGWLTTKLVEEAEKEKGVNYADVYKNEVTFLCEERKKIRAMILNK